jgi:RsiW-degrading membrane proteinase PrsW (M82 family)
MDHRERLEQYRHLYESGLISADEYQRQVGRIKAAERMRLLEEGGVAALFHLEPGIAARVLTSQVFWVVLVLAMMPFVLAFIGVPPEQGMILYFAFLWFFLYLRLFRFNLIGSFSMDFAFTAFLVVFPGLALVLPALQWLLGGFYALVRARVLVLQWPGFVFGVGIAEELTKLLPVVIVLWLARRTGRRIGLQASILLGITSGLAFAGFENILYSEQYGARLFGMKFTLQGVVVSRLLMTPFLHSVWAGITGFAVGAAAAMGPGSWVRGLRIVAPWLLFAAILHGSYDTFSFSPVLAVVTAAVSYLVLTAAVVVAKHWEGDHAAFLNEKVL